MDDDRERLILASASPRRRELLRLLGIGFEVASTDVDETALPNEPGDALAGRLSVAKAVAAGRTASDRIILAADTVVEIDGRTLGKPADPEAATAMLRLLRGRAHRVLTGVAIAVGRRVVRTTVVDTIVEMRAYDDDELSSYVAGGQSLDKAGGYAIQDVDFRPARRVRGCYPNVVGLPLCEVLRGLRAVGFDVHVPADADLQPPCRLCTRALPSNLRVDGTRAGIGGCDSPV